MFYRCVICRSSYDPVRIVPKVLSCGHSFCTNCLDTYLRVSKDREIEPVCQVCRDYFTMYDDGYITNFALINNGQSNPVVSNELTDRFKRLKNEFSNAVGCINKEIRRLRSKEGPHDDVQNQTFGHVQNQASGHAQNQASGQSSRVEVRPTISLTQFEKRNLFFYKIALKASSKESIYVGHVVEDKVKYGKITCDYKHVFFHALTLSEIDKGASVVSLLDVKEYAKKKFYCFIEVETTKLLVNIENHLLEIFIIERFTGETGYCLKDAQLKLSCDLSDPLMEICTQHESYGLNSFGKEEVIFSFEEASHAESHGSGTNSTGLTRGNISPKEIVLTMRNSENFNISDLNSNIYEKIIGRLVDISLTDFTVLALNSQIESNVLDCGLALSY